MVLIWLRVPAWMPLAPHHGMRWLYGLRGRSAAMIRGEAEQTDGGGKRWVAQRIQSHGRV